MGASLLASPLTALLGWAGLLIAAWVSLTDNGAWVFKLDSFVYYYAVLQWHDGGSLYEWYANPAQSLWPFTYTPLAAWLITPLTLLTYEWATALLVAATPLCAGLTAWAALRALAGDRPGPSTPRPSTPQRRALIRGAAPWVGLLGVMLLEPFPKTMEYGQVNAILMALVAVDLLLVPERSRWRGALSGLAAAIKLTPAIAVLVLLARGEWRAAATMVGSAVGLTALAALASPTETWDFFTWAMWDSGRAGFADYSGNQNLKGAIARGLPESLWTPAWAACAAAAVLAAWLLCRRLDALRSSQAGALLPSPSPAVTSQTGTPLTGSDSAPTPSAPWDDGLILLLQVCAVMTLGLLISPISWSHHWVWSLPSIIALGAASWRWYSTSLGVAALAGAMVFIVAMQWWFPEQNHVEQDWPTWAKAVGSSYTWWALGSGVTLALVAGRRARRSA
ncbi:glycosyltransferase 87 family protein [Actinomyces slackii]|uniref:Polyprenol-phosphate-mannose-dependent alpha-(1-2)-phosphatidylinositol mannoside mannosyltransferase n=2 Tax=Actinomyces slackii TaxID=52774 RepID=A0A448K9Z4_9ACTO|nr:glycosyltransferase 87 family protein [Actinomyces slackii]VEG73739.1 Polyprenol-phosphate-mannose-dependent alpha-(1-2)-phosphatidylinositol mannoside mannosyltransferase [Actinomyces slackii]